MQWQKQDNKVGKDACECNCEGEHDWVDTGTRQIEVPHCGYGVTLERGDQDGRYTPSQYDNNHYQCNDPERTDGEDATIEQQYRYLGRRHGKEIK